MAAANRLTLVLPVLRLLALAVAGFFAVTLILPIDTMGDPAFDIPQLRARWFTGFGIVWLQLALIVGLVFWAIKRPSWAVTAALVSTAVALGLMVVEEGQLIRHGALILPHDAAMFRLNTNRVMTCVFSLATLLALWRVDARV